MTGAPFSFGASASADGAGTEVVVAGIATVVAEGAEGGCVVLPFVSVVVVSSPALLSPLTGTTVSVEMARGSVFVAVDVLVVVASIVFSLKDT